MLNPFVVKFAPRRAGPACYQVVDSRDGSIEWSFERESDARSLARELNAAHYAEACRSADYYPGIDD